MENSKIICKELGCNSGGGNSSFNETEHKVMLEFTDYIFHIFNYQQEFSKWVRENEQLLKKLEEKFGNKKHGLKKKKN